MSNGGYPGFGTDQVAQHLAQRVYILPVADVTALALIPERNRVHGMKIFMQDGGVAHWDANSELDASAGEVVEASDTPDVGRYIIDTPAGGIVSGGASAGDSWKPDVRLATTAALSANTRTGNVLTADAAGALEDIDGVTPAAGDDILVMNETTGANNGIYTVTTAGDGSTAWSMTRRADADTSAKVTGGFSVKVRAGTVYGGRVATLVTTAAITLNTTAMTFTTVEDRTSWKADVICATTTTLGANTRTGNVLLADANGALGAIDGVTPTAGQDILVKDEATQANNGIYRVISAGSGGSKFKLVRRSDADTSAKVTGGMQVRVRSGTANGQKTFYMTATSAVTLNTTALVFSEWKAAPRGRTVGSGTLTNGVLALSSLTISASAKVMLSRTVKNASSALGFLTHGSITAGSGDGAFTVTSLKPADATTETGDQSSFNYEIIEP